MIINLEDLSFCNLKGMIREVLRAPVVATLRGKIDTGIIKFVDGLLRPSTLLEMKSASRQRKLYSCPLS